MQQSVQHSSKLALQLGRPVQYLGPGTYVAGKGPMQHLGFRDLYGRSTDAGMSLSMIGQHSWLTWTKCMVACNAIATQCYTWKVYVLMLSLVQRPVGFMRICDC